MLKDSNLRRDIDGGRRDGKIVASRSGHPFGTPSGTCLHHVKEDVMPTISRFFCPFIVLTDLTVVAKIIVSQCSSLFFTSIRDKDLRKMRQSLGFWLLDFLSGFERDHKNFFAINKIAKNIVFSFFSIGQNEECYTLCRGYCIKARDLKVSLFA